MNAILDNGIDPRSKQEWLTYQFCKRHIFYNLIKEIFKTLYVIKTKRSHINCP